MPSEAREEASTTNAATTAAKTQLEIQVMILERIRELLGISVFFKKLLLMSRGDL
jgi:hypothetical protein